LLLAEVELALVNREYELEPSVYEDAFESEFAMA